MLAPSRTGEPVHNDEDWFIRRDGTLFPVSYTAAPIDLPSGRGVVMTFVDMTAQRRAEQSLRERDAILARVAQPVWVIDHRGRFHYANPAAVAALGYDESPSCGAASATRPSTTSTPTELPSRQRTAR